MKYTLTKTSYVFNARRETLAMTETFDSDDVFELIATMGDVLQKYSGKYPIKIESNREHRYLIFDVPEIEETVKFEFKENE